MQFERSCLGAQKGLTAMTEELFSVCTASVGKTSLDFFP
jgi:hypothetical protein